MVEFMMITSMWESMAAWFTPTVLFCLTNFIIATIFIASNKHHDHGDSPSVTPISRVSSFIDRARLVNLSSYTTTEPQHHHQPQPKTANYNSTSRLAQSIYLSPGYVTPIELSNSEGSSPTQPARTPSLFQRVKSIKFSNESNENVFPVKSDSPGQLARVPSFLDRVKSFKIYSPFNRTENVDTHLEHHVILSKSEKKAAKKKSLVEMKKSRSEVKIATNEDEDEDEEEDVDLRRPATTRESRNDLDEEVDAKADDFISRFKQQLKLQRLESLVRYNEMLNRRSNK